MTRLAVILTCHNRREKTLTCLDALARSAVVAAVDFHAYLVDDGCSDGTGEAVKQKFPRTTVILGSGALFWNGGMRLGFREALRRVHDHYLWLNDDTELFPDALAELFAAYRWVVDRTGEPGIIAGTVTDREGNAPSYGGMRQTKAWHPLAYELVTPGVEPIECDTMNGNCVLIPHPVAKSVGNLDAEFVHTMGDMDYGLRARRLGARVWVMAGYAGLCARNAASGSYRDTALPVTQRLKRLVSPKGMPWRSWLVYAKRHAGVLWPIFLLWPYASVLISGFLHRKHKA
jgi:GT2 family glycosyltransferase